MSDKKKKETRQPWKERPGTVGLIPKSDTDKKKALLDKMRGKTPSEDDESKPE